MKCIELTKGYVAIVDDEDFERLAQWRWRYCEGYAVRSMPGNRRRVIWMHREINGTPDGFETDHRNTNKLDNRRQNLRTATHSQNKCNQTKRGHNTSGFKGAFFHKNSGLWRGQITVKGKNHYLGYFKTPVEAAAAYDRAAIELHGEFAHLN